MKYLVALVVVVGLSLVGVAYVGYHVVNDAIDNFHLPK